MADSGAAGAGAPAAGEKFTLDVLDVVKTAQAQNGLRHNDYVRYGAYCARRLDTVRHAKAVAWTYGTSRKYVKRELKAEDVRDARHLQIPLYNAERAWAQSQKLKLDASDGTDTAADRHQARHRLKKAVKWAGDLEALAGARGDARTALEAQAYASWMRAQYAVETEVWVDGSRNLKVVAHIYKELSTVASRRVKELYAGRLDEVAAMDRFCTYQLGRSGRAAGGSGAAAAVAGAGAPPVAELAASLAEAMSTSAAGELTVHWRGVMVPLRGDKIRGLVSGAVAKAKELAAYAEGGEGSGSAGTEALYLELLTRLDECARVAAAEAHRATKDGKAAAAVDARAVEDYLRFVRARTVLDRAGVMATAAVAAFDLLVAAGRAGSVPGSSGGSGGSGAAGGDAGGAGGARKGGKAGKRPRAAEGGEEGAGGEDAAAAAATARRLPVQPTSVLTSNPWLSVLASSHAAVPPVAATGEGAAAAAGPAPREGASPHLVSAAYDVISWYARSLRTVDDMIALAGGTPPAEGPTGALPPTPPSIAPSDLPADEALVTALLARRQLLAAWRGYFVACAAVAAKRFSDATVMMHRAQRRADTTLDLLRALPAQLRPRDLPDVPAAPLAALDDGAASATPAPVLLSGLSKGEAAGATALLDCVAQQTVALQATALMEQLAPRIRADGSFASSWAASFGPDAPVLAALAEAVPRTHALSRAIAGAPRKLVRDPTAGAGFTTLAERSAAGTALTAVTDAGSLGGWPPRPVPAPFKPILLDLALKHFVYPEPDLSGRVKVTKPAAAPTAAAAAGAGGGAGAGKAPATPAPAPASSGGGKATPASPAPAPAPAPDTAAAGGGGLLSWLTGR